MERDREEIWSRLRRRKVVQWGLLYVAGAWGFLQGLEYVGESFNWPQQVRQVALLALVIGLPIVLVLAWYHGDRGQQRISTPEFSILTLLLLLGGGRFWYYQRASERSRERRSRDGKHHQTGRLAPSLGCTAIGCGAALREPIDISVRAEAAGLPCVICWLTSA
jgi:hypothetical protein